MLVNYIFHDLKNWLLLVLIKRNFTAEALIYIHNFIGICLVFDGILNEIYKGNWHIQENILK